MYSVCGSEWIGEEFGSDARAWSRFLASDRPGYCGDVLKRALHFLFLVVGEIGARLEVGIEVKWGTVKAKTQVL